MQDRESLAGQPRSHEVSDVDGHVVSVAYALYVCVKERERGTQENGEYAKRDTARVFACFNGLPPEGPLSATLHSVIDAESIRMKS